MSNSNIELEILRMTVRELSPIINEFVFIGGATISLHIDEPQHIVVRETLDVDCVVEVAHREEYEQISKKLRNIGFSEDMSSPVICRFRKRKMILDVMPTNEKILGFSNKWYAEGYKKSVTKNVDGIVIKVFDVPYMVATKIEAFKGRGKNQYSTSHDIEDIVTIIDGCSQVSSKIQSAGNEIKAFLKKELQLMMSNNQFLSSIDAHISDRTNLSARKQIILNRIKSAIL